MFLVIKKQNKSKQTTKQNYMELNSANVNERGPQAPDGNHSTGDTLISTL